MKQSLELNYGVLKLWKYTHQTAHVVYLSEKESLRPARLPRVAKSTASWMRLAISRHWLSLCSHTSNLTCALRPTTWSRGA